MRNRSTQEHEKNKHTEDTPRPVAIAWWALSPGAVWSTTIKIPSTAQHSKEAPWRQQGLSFLEAPHAQAASVFRIYIQATRQRTHKKSGTLKMGGDRSYSSPFQRRNAFQNELHQTSQKRGNAYISIAQPGPCPPPLLLPVRDGWLEAP